jgi:hypothetical protein
MDCNGVVARVAAEHVAAARAEVKVEVEVAVEVLTAAVAAVGMAVAVVTVVAVEECTVVTVAEWKAKVRAVARLMVGAVARSVLEKVAALAGETGLRCSNGSCRSRASRCRTPLERPPTPACSSWRRRKSLGTHPAAHRKTTSTPARCGRLAMARGVVVTAVGPKGRLVRVRRVVVE